MELGGHCKSKKVRKHEKEKVANGTSKPSVLSELQVILLRHDKRRTISTSMPFHPHFGTKSSFLVNTLNESSYRRETAETLIPDATDNRGDLPKDKIETFHG